MQIMFLCLIVRVLRAGGGHSNHDESKDPIMAAKKLKSCGCGLTSARVSPR